MNYAARIISTALAESKEKHTPSVKMLVQAYKCLDSGEACEKRFYADLWLGDRTIEHSVKTLREIGFQGQSLVDLNYPDTLKDVEIEISTEIVEYNGQNQEKVKFVNPAGSFANRGIKACSDDVARNIAHRYDSVLRGGKITRSQPNPAPGPAYGDQADDLPF